MKEPEGCRVNAPKHNVLTADFAPVVCNVLFILDVSRVYANSFPDKTGKKQNQSVHTLHF